jgi:hypothetical protein
MTCQQLQLALNCATRESWRVDEGLVAVAVDESQFLVGREIEEPSVLQGEDRVVLEGVELAEVEQVRVEGVDLAPEQHEAAEVRDPVLGEALLLGEERVRSVVDFREHASLGDVEAFLLKIVLVGGVRPEELGNDLSAADATGLVHVVENGLVPVLLILGLGDAEEAVGRRADDVGQGDRDLDLRGGHARGANGCRRAPPSTRSSGGPGCTAGAGTAFRSWGAPRKRKAAPSKRALPCWNGSSTPPSNAVRP